MPSVPLPKLVEQPPRPYGVTPPPTEASSSQYRHPYDRYVRVNTILYVQWNLHKTDTIGEQPFGRYGEVVFLERFQLPDICMLYESFLPANESWSFANCFISSYKLRKGCRDKLQLDFHNCAK